MKSRSLSVILLVLMVLFFAAAGLARAVQAIQKWRFLDEILPISPGYLVVTGLFWFVAGLALAWGVWTGRRWAGKSLLAAIGLYSLLFWMEWYGLAFSGRSAGPIDNGPFLVLINVLVVAWTVWEFYRPALMHRSEEPNERQSES